MGSASSKSQARRRVREAQARANEARLCRERANVEDVATLVVAQSRLGGIDKWEADRVGQIRAEGQRRRAEHRAKAAAAIGRLQQRGESLQSIAALAEVSVAELRAVLKDAAAGGARGAAGMRGGTEALGAEVG